jgi:hypothetical protein
VLFLSEMSEEFPDVTFTIRWSVEPDNAWTYHVEVVKNGRWRLTEKQVGWFRLMLPPYPAPVHHYVVWFDESVTAAQIKELEDRTVLWQAETVDTLFSATPPGGYATRTPPDQLGLPVRRVCAYTLDDKIYTASMNARAREQEYRQLTICECPITLTEAEKDWIRADDLLDLPDDTDDTDERTSWDQVLAYSRHRLGIDSTRLDLARLLNMPGLTDARRAEITAAMQAPGWYQEPWPPWEGKDRPKKTPEPEPVSQEDFLEQLPEAGGQP